MSDAPHEVMTWDELGAGARELAAAVRDDGFAPDLVLGIARGGLLVAGALGYALGVKNTFTMNVEFYTGIDERLEMPMILPPVPALVDLERERVLVADDVADTGLTLELVKDFCAARSARCAAPCSTRSRGRWSSASTSGDAPTAGSTFPGAPASRERGLAEPSGARRRTNCGMISLP